MTALVEETLDGTNRGSTDSTRKSQIKKRRTPSDATNNNTDIDPVNQQLIGIDGKWYDVTSFIPHHPGGEIIKLFAGKDASAVFRGFHERDVLKNRKPVGQYTRDCSQKIHKAFADLHLYFQHEGYFKTSLQWYAVKVIITFTLLLTSIYLVVSCQEWHYHYLGAVFLAAFWQQNGFFMHDAMHTQIFHNRWIDNWLGTFFGTACFGISGSWWRDEHFYHHALVNTIDSVNNQRLDPQMQEPIWAQNKKLCRFYQTYIQYLFIKIQHITFIPVCVFIGRIGITIDSFKQERRIHELLAGLIHWTWVLLLVLQLPTLREKLIFYGIASSCEGILHIQLLVSHYAKPFFDLDKISTSLDWYEMQIKSNINIVCPEWLDWFHGGLNFHIEHHLYPLMPRHNYRRASRHIKRVCHELGLEYDECPWSTAIVRTLRCLRQMSIHFKLDPR